jgi:hypothetical protein
MPHHVKIGTIVGMLSRTLQLTTLRPQFVKECVYILRLFHSDREYSLTYTDASQTREQTAGGRLALVSL